MSSTGDIRAWLAELGLAKYAEAFASNDIDLDILPELTDADLERLGVASLGDRKRLLKAIASIASAEKSSVVPTTTGPSPTDAERRQVTVMFSDLVSALVFLLGVLDQRTGHELVEELAHGVALVSPLELSL